MKTSSFLPFVFLFVVIAVVSLACGGGAEATSAPEPTATEAPLSLTYSNHEVRDAWVRLATNNARDIVKVCSPGIPLVETGAACMIVAEGCMLEATTAQVVSGNIGDDCYKLGNALMEAARIGQ